jgi:hypothetical protein
MCYMVNSQECIEMVINFSLPIVCYMKFFNEFKRGTTWNTRLKNFLNNKNEEVSNYWISTIYSSTDKFIGLRELEFGSDHFIERTFDSLGNQISYSGIPSIEPSYIDIRINFLKSDKVISKFYQLIDTYILECVTTEVGKDILSFETLTAPPPDSNNENWDTVFSNQSWYCFLKDSDHNEIGYREINIGKNYCYVKTSFNNKINSQYEHLERIDKKSIDEYGSLFRYIEYLKLYNQDGQSKFSKGGILLDTSSDIEYHKSQSQKLKSK